MDVVFYKLLAWIVAACFVLPVSVLLTGCGRSQKVATDRLPVVTNFYPVQFLARQVGGGTGPAPLA
ncbi:hypothetical protein GCM10022220_51080 [Actinocatenispora rupis]|uniref:Lipoprotein n=1 Tax=Actinocatenispora rupis TaxID=519421 RepID=A0A8J3NFH9_9ACTN|nr:hypothetical protein Aru02nite_47030 [Actinocatenispora rupis]